MIINFFQKKCRIALETCVEGPAFTGAEIRNVPPYTRGARIPSSSVTLLRILALEYLQT